MTRYSFVMIFAMLFAFTVSAAAEKKTFLKPNPQALKNWQALRFGMFIHWGPNCQKGGEISWSRKGPRRGRSSKGNTGYIPMEIYDNLYKTFNPTKFNADRWVQIARDGGMKYMILTSKHHDGFSMFNSKLTEYDIMSTPFGRDVVKELSEACKRAGMRFGVYYSPRDWHHPDFGTSRHNRYLDFYMGQLKELVTNYDNIFVLWFDGLDSPRKLWKNIPEESFKMLRGIRPDILLNNRGGLRGDFDTPEQRVGGFNRTRPWETCMTICRQWSWKPNDRMKSLKQCIQTLLATAGGDGNLLFNVGPMPDGRIEPRQVKRLKEMGDWLKKYGDGVYGTRGGPFKPGRWGASTCKAGKIYLFIMNWSEDNKMKLPAINRRIKNARVLPGGKIKLSQTSDGLELSLPEKYHDDIATVVVLTVEGEAFTIKPVSVVYRSHSVAFGRKVTASNVFSGNKNYAADKAFDDDPSTRWATDAGTHNCWIEVDLGKPTKIGNVFIDEREWNRVKKFELQFKDGNGSDWKTIIAGTVLGANYRRKFNPVTAKNVRLNIIEATEGPTIWEFQLFP